MQYFTSYYQQAEEGNTTSVLLQQVYHKKRRMPVILACVATEGNSYQTGLRNIKYRNELLHELENWFYGVGLSLCGRSGEQGMDAIVDDFANKVNKALHDCKEIAACKWAGALCVGQSILLFWQGEQQISLLNTRNHRSYCHGLNPMGSGTDGPNFQLGTIQRGAGVLLATEEFYRCISVKKMEECLNMREMISEEQADRRLRELGVHAEEQRGNGLGAILIVVR